MNRIRPIINAETAQGTTKEHLVQLIELFFNQDLNKGVPISVGAAEVEDQGTVQEFQSYAVARFVQEGQVFLVTASQHVFNVSEVVAELQEFLPNDEEDGGETLPVESPDPSPVGSNETIVVEESQVV